MSEVIKLDFAEVLKELDKKGFFDHPEKTIEIEYKEKIGVIYEMSDLGRRVTFVWKQNQENILVEIINGNFLNDGNIETVRFKKISFVGNVISNLKQYNLYFLKCIFNDEIMVSAHDENRLMEYPKTLSIQSCVFEERVEFSNISFSNNVICYRNIFEKNALFTNSIFKNTATFELTHFKQTGSFVKSEFLGGVRFNSAEFRKGMFECVVLKSFCYFQSCIIDANKCAFNGITIECEEENVFNFIESHCKYLEKQNENVVNQSETNETIQMMRDTARKIKSTFLAQHNMIEAAYWSKVELYCREIELRRKKESNLLDWIEKIQLGFYRHISDHHTDLFKIISWVIIAIGSLGVFLLAIDSPEDLISAFCPNAYGIVLSFSLIVMLILLIMIGYIHFFFLLTGIGLLSTLWLTCYEPKIIFGVTSVFDKSSDMTGIKGFVLVFYCLIMILLLFSLQKTARKNSIVQS